VLSLSASKIIGVQFQGDSSAASYAGAGGAAGAIDEDDDGKLCTKDALTKENSVIYSLLLFFVPGSCALSLSDALFKWCRHPFRPFFARCTQRHNGIISETQTIADAFLQHNLESLTSAIVLQMYLSSQALMRQNNSLPGVVFPPVKVLSLSRIVVRYVRL